MAGTVDGTVPEVSSPPCRTSLYTVTQPTIELAEGRRVVHGDLGTGVVKTLRRRDAINPHVMVARGGELEQFTGRTGGVSGFYRELLHRHTVPQTAVCIQIKFDSGEQRQFDLESCCDGSLRVFVPHSAELDFLNRALPLVSIQPVRTFFDEFLGFGFQVFGSGLSFRVRHLFRVQGLGLWV